MHVTYSPDVETFRDEVRSWLHEQLPPGWNDDAFRLEPERRSAFRDAWDRAMYDAGWICASWPKEYGGRGLSAYESVVLAEEFARAQAPMRVSSLGEILVGPTLLRWGTEDQKQEFLPRILRGESVWCQGFSEPESGSDLASLTTRAVREGDDFVVDGEKIWTSEAESADYMILLARTNPDVPRHGGISFLLLAMDQPGVDVQPIAQIDGTAGFNRVLLRGARCPAANLVGGLDNGWKVAMTTLGFERGTSTITSYHRFRRDLDEIIACARERDLADDVIVRQRIASAWIAVEILGISGQRTLAALERGREDRDLAALEAVNKLYWTEHDKRAMNLAIDLLGPDAMLLLGTDDDERRASVGLGHRAVVHRYPASPLQSGFLFSLSGTIYGGTSEVQRNVIAERTLGLPREPSR